MMKKHIFIPLLGILTLLASACSSDNDDNLSVQENVTLSGLSVSSISFEWDGSASEGAEAIFSVNCAAVPSVSADAAWLSVERVNSSNKLHTYSVSASTNASQEPRTGLITIMAGKTTETVTVTQEGAPAQTDNPEETQPLMGINATDIARDMGNGWNIGNTLEAIGGETAWGNPKINEAYIKGIKEAGFNAVRIPCAWDCHIIDSSNTIDPVWLNRVNEVVGMVLDNDMYAIVNIHWDGGWLENNIGTQVKSSLLEKQTALWAQIANRLGHYNERLLFAGLNEPNADDANAAKVLLQYEQAFIDAVRATGGNNNTRTLIFQGPNTDISKTYDNFSVNPSDPAGEGYLMAEIHYYDPYQYTIMDEDADWGEISLFWGSGYHHEGGIRNVTWGEEEWMKQQFDKMKTKFVDNNIPVIIGEYGAYPEEHYRNLTNGNVSLGLTGSDELLISDSRAYFYSCVQKFGKERGLIPFVWDTGELIDRNTGSVTKQYMIDAIREGSDAVSYSY